MKPRSDGLAANNPFSTASVALNDNVIIELMMSSIRACKAISGMINAKRTTDRRTVREVFRQQRDV